MNDKYKVLRFHWRGTNVDIRVEVDNCSLLDIVREFEDEAAKLGQNLNISFRTFSYVFEVERQKLEAEEDLKRMFNRLSEKNLIYIWVGTVITPTPLYKLVMDLRDKSKHMEIVERDVVIGHENDLPLLDDHKDTSVKHAAANEDAPKPNIIEVNGAMQTKLSTKVLRFKWRDKNAVDIGVEADKCSLLDVIIEYEDKATKLGQKLDFKFPTFSYVSEKEHQKLETDKDLMKMFNKLSEKNLIYIWVGNVITPTPLYKLVMDYREKSKCMEIVENDVVNEHENDLPSKDTSVKHAANEDALKPNITEVNEAMQTKPSAKVLRFKWRDKNGVDIGVGVDKCSLLDIIIEYEDEATNLGQKLEFSFPTFSYVFEEEHQKLETDEDLRIMFNKLSEKNLIYIWVGTVITPTPLYKLVMDYREQSKCTEIGEHDVDNEPENDLPPLYDHEDTSVKHAANEDVPKPNITEVNEAMQTKPPAKVLRFKWRDKNVVEIRVEVGKCSLLDIVMEYEDKALTLGQKLHYKFPTFGYVYQKKHKKLKTDEDLLEMFNRLPQKNMIDIWVGTVIAPTPLYKLVMDFRDKSMCKKILEPDEVNEHENHLLLLDNLEVEDTSVDRTTNEDAVNPSITEVDEATKIKPSTKVRKHTISKAENAKAQISTDELPLPPISRESITFPSIVPVSDQSMFTQNIPKARNKRKRSCTHSQSVGMITKSESGIELGESRSARRMRGLTRKEMRATDEPVVNRHLRVSDQSNEAKTAANGAPEGHKKKVASTKKGKAGKVKELLS